MKFRENFGRDDRKKYWKLLSDYEGKSSIAIEKFNKKELHLSVWCYFSGCRPSQVRAEDTFDDFLTQEDITAVNKILEQDDVLKSTKSILKHIWPFKKYL